MLRRLVFVLFCMVASPWTMAEEASAQSAYNQGVQAFRAKDYVVARENWARASELGDISAMNNLGYLLFEGLGGQIDLARAVFLWTRAAQSGHSEAQWHLGFAYESGKGAPQDEKAAYAWYRCALAGALSAAEADETEAVIAADVSRALTKLLARIPVAQLAEAEELARRQLSSIAQKAAK